jgi:hypothetical protein
MVEPISPQDLERRPEVSFPDFVLEAINGLITSKYRNGVAKFTQDEAVDAITANAPGFMGMERAEVFSKHYLDFEDVYRKQGWKVYFDRPGFNESYTATFTFSK